MNPNELFNNAYTEFECEDPFNANIVKGYISRLSTDLYGALLIESVNGKSCPQLIRCTPKMHYPFDKQGTYHFPKAIRIERYEKLDGTNIFSFVYKNSSGQKFVSHKTRLMPFIGDSKFGPFRSMLKDIFSEKPELEDLPNAIGYNISYELWGARNPHLIKYKEPLKLSILFGRKNNKVLPPSEFSHDHDAAPFLGNIDDQIITSYKEAQSHLESSLSQDQEGYYVGTEGEIWYLQDETGEWNLFKCKPETIEAIHWASGGIGKNQIAATCENALESWDIPTVENVEILLLEEFTPQEVEKVKYRIKDILVTVIEKHLFIERVLRAYNSLGINILEDKQTVMRILSQKFARREMQYVYGVIMNYV